MAKRKPNKNGIVYSTDPSFSFNNETGSESTLPAGSQKLIIRLETRHRAGKAVTVVQGFAGQADDLEDLGRKLRNFCGAGGSVKEGEIIIQGDNRDKILNWLINNGYKQAKKY